jgi:ankyrin repeat protein
MYETILLHSASQQETPEIVGTLLNRGLKLNAKNPWGETVLHSVSRGRQGTQGGVRVAKLLLECGVDVNARRKDHQTPLHVASYYGNVEIVRLLLDNGADHEAAGIMGEKPLHHLSYGKYRSQDDGVHVTQLLLDYGADVNSRRKDDLTPLHLASYFCNVEITRLLLDNGANIDAVDKFGKTPFYGVTQGQSGSQDGLHVARLLLAHCADVNTKARSGSTPLALESHNKRSKLSQLFFKHAANVRRVGR